MGNAQLIRSTNPFAADSAGGSTFIQYVSASDGASGLFNACAAVQSAGGGLILVGPGVIDNTATPALGVFANCTGIGIIGYGTTIQNTTPTTGPQGYVFQFTNCTNVRVGGFTVIGTASASDIQSATVKNQVFCAVTAGCVNVEFFNVIAQGILTPFEVYNQDGSGNPTTPIVRNVSVRNVQAKNCWYGMICQFGPDGLDVENLRTDTVHRDFFIYGASNVQAEIFSKDAWSDGVRLGSFQGRGNSNVSIVYHSDETSTARSDSGALVSLCYDFVAVPVTHKNIKIVFDVKFPGSGTANTGECAFVIRKSQDGGGVFDTTDRGHILDGLDLSGRIENYPNFTGFGLIDVDVNSKWGTVLDSWYNINIHDLHTKSAVFCRLSCASLKGLLHLSNVQCDAAFRIEQQNRTGSEDQSFPQTGRVLIDENCSFTNLRYFTGDGAVALRPIRLTSSAVIPVSYSGQTMSNDGAVGAIMPPLPPASSGNIALGLGPMTFINSSSVGTFRIDPDGTDVILPGGAGKYMDLALGATATIIPVKPGVWQILSSYGTVTFEP